LEASGPGAEQLAESFRLDLADALSQLPRIQVRADHSFSDARQDAASVRNLAQTLQLDDLLYGKLSLDDTGHCTLELELVRGRDAVHLASFRYAGTVQQLASIRDQVQRDVFARLEMSAQTGNRMPGSTENPVAYEDYLQARSGLLMPTNDSLRKALRGFQSAVAADPGFAKAWSGMATAYVLEAEHSVAPKDASYSQAKMAARKAVQLDPMQAEAHATLGFVAFRQDWDSATAERELREAVTIEPNQAVHHVMFALLLGNTSRFHEAFEQIEMARADDPLWPPVYLTEMYLASCAGLNSKAIGIAQKLIALMPGWPLAYDQRGWAYWYAGRYAEAINDWHTMAFLEKDAARLHLEDQGLTAFRRGGVRAYARLRLAAIHSNTQWAHPNDFLPAEWSLKAGDRSAAFRDIQEMVAKRDPDSLELAVSPAFEDLRGDPAFLALLRHAGLPLPVRPQKG